LVQDLNQGGSAFRRSSSLAIGVAVILAVVGSAMAIYPISVGESNQANLPGGQNRTMTSNAETGIVSIPSIHSVDRAVEKLEEILQSKGVKLFALADHSGEAKKRATSETSP
jgi:hypothetical protein